MAELNTGNEEEPGRGRIALCLSGGGLRATLFHFGLIKAMRSHTKGGVTALASVREIYSVSGGSIAGAHLVRNWDAYCDTEDHAGFDRLQEEILSFACRNLRDRVLRRWLITRGAGRIADRLLPGRLKSWLRKRFGTRRAYWLQREYAKGLLGWGSIADCYRAPAGRPPVPDPAHRDPPMLYILATSFTTGELCSFSCNDFEVEPHEKSDRGHSCPGGHLPLAYAVAASSAFPPMFPPLLLTKDMLLSPRDPYFNTGILLSDGGVFDNLGVEKFRARREADKSDTRSDRASGFVTPSMDDTLLIVSNAGGSFTSGLGESYGSVVARNVRASDILMRRVGDFAEHSASGISGVSVMNVRIGRHAHDAILRPATQESLRLVRTDLDIFDRKLAAMLIDHGFRIGGAQLRAGGWEPTDQDHRQLIPQTELDQALGSVAGAAAQRWIWSLWLDWRDWKTVPFMWLGSLFGLAALLFVIVGVPSLIYFKDKANYALRMENIQLKKQKVTASLLAEETRDAQASNNIYIAQQQTLKGVTSALAAGDTAAANRLLTMATRISNQASAGPQADIQAASARTIENQINRVVSDKPYYKVEAAPSEYKQPVFIQFAGILTRAQITGLNQALKEAGWQVQGASGERTPAAAGQNEVRYAGNNGAAAAELAATLTRTGIVSGTTVRARNVEAIGPRNLEVWISR